MLKLKVEIKKEVKYQNIGGKKMTLDKEMCIGDILDTKFSEMPIAMFEFAKRRIDLIDEKYEKMNVYYGHVINDKGFSLGYFIAEDEIDKKLYLSNLIKKIVEKLQKEKIKYKKESDN